MTPSCGFDDCVHDCEAETGALDRLVGRARGAEEPLKELILVFSGHAHLVVRDFDHAYSFIASRSRAR
jgi:formate dehydrogenase assembly factor FdhD